ncbi:hypothetical protein [Dietzia sp. UBA5065]|jgi:hypothetical protein|uniref:hypothetical protein n=1 Tax=Dietzia sp. UBA5065 TaxID=1946422 RepID=UPI0025BBB4AB|nr:hypothetical protein [Dietzia sp. UBA5065]HMT50490.1 hypothetical protein [Dietzia sp.]
MTIHAPHVPDRAASPESATAGTRKAQPVIQSRVGAPVALAGLAIALISLYLPWVSGGGQSITGISLPDVLGLRAITPVNFLGLVGLSVLAVVTLLSRLGIFAILNAVTATLVLVAHLGFVWVLYGSTGTSEPTLTGLSPEMAVTYGPYVAVIGFVLVIAGSVAAAMSAEYLLPDRAEGRLLARG